MGIVVYSLLWVRQDFISSTVSLLSIQVLLLLLFLALVTAADHLERLTTVTHPKPNKHFEALDSLRPKHRNPRHGCLNPRV